MHPGYGLGITTEPEAPVSYRAVFQVRGLPQLTISTLFSRVGTQMFAVLVVLFVLKTYNSPAFSGIVILCSQAPGILASPVAGALLDRGSKIRLMAFDYAVEASAIGLIGILSVTGHLPKVALLVIALAGSFTQPLSRVGARTLYPIIVPPRLWDRTNALDSGSQLIATVLGPTAAGLSDALVGPHYAMLIVAGTFVIASMSLIGVKMPPTERTSESGLFKDAKDAVSYVLHNRVLRMLAGSFTLYSGAQNALLVGVPVLILHRIHGGSAAVGLVIAVFGFAGFCGGFVAGRVGTAGRERQILAQFCFTSAIAIGVMSIAHSYFVLVPMMAVVGASSAPMVVAMFSLRQRATDPDWYGRAFAVSMNLNYGLAPVGSAAVGLIISHSISAAFIFMAVVAGLAGVWPVIVPASFYEPTHDHSLRSTET
jgi:predicted MFS family arabinose efflux permease